MSAKTTSFALEQKQLDPAEQLALIIISDCCGDYFTSAEAVKAITHHTKLNEDEAFNAIHNLVEMHIIREQILKHRPNAEMYFVMVVRS